MKYYFKKILKITYDILPQKIRNHFSTCHGRKYLPAGTVSNGDGKNLHIGDRVSFGGNVFVAGDSYIEIGHDSMIAYGVTIHTSTHNYDNNPVWKNKIEMPISIGNNVWIGTGAIILPGVKIGDFSVIAAGSVVACHVPAGAVVAGNPAKILKLRDVKEYENSYDYSAHYPGKTIIGDFLENDKVCKMKK